MAANARVVSSGTRVINESMTVGKNLTITGSQHVTYAERSDQPFARQVSDENHEWVSMHQWDPFQRWR